MLDSLFNNVAGLQTRNIIKKCLQHRCFPVNVANFLRTAISMYHLWWPTRKGKGAKCRTKERGKIFEVKNENGNISFNFYLQVLALVKTENQIQLCEYYGSPHPFFLTFSSKFLSCDSGVFIFSCFHSWKIKKHLVYIY